MFLKNIVWSESLRKYLPCFVIVLAVLIAYFNVYSNSFLWDDEFLIVKNRFIRSFEYLPQIFTLPSGAGANRIDNFYRPIQIFSYLIIYKLFGLSNFAFHFLNVFLHVLNAIILYVILKKLFNNRVAFLTALFWAIHPVHTEAITYMSGTADPLSFLFMLIAFLNYLSFKEKSSIKHLIISVIFFTLALMSKETAIIFPLVLLLYEKFILLKKQKRIKFSSMIRSFLFTTPLFFVSAIYFILRLTVLNFGNTLNLYSTENIYTQHLSYRLYTFIATLPHYFSFIFYPVHLHMERSFPIFISILSKEVLVPLIVIIAVVLTLFFALFKNHKQENNPFYLGILFGILWFFIFMIPFSGIIPANSIILEHWLYVPSIGIFLILALFLEKLFYRILDKKLLYLLIFAIACILVILTINQNALWKDPIVFYNNILKYEEGTARVHNNLAMAYADLGRLDLAEEHYLKAINISDSYAETHYNLARLYLQQNKTRDAIIHLERSIEINPSFFYSYYLLSQIYASLGLTELSNEYLKKAQSLEFYCG